MSIATLTRAVLGEMIEERRLHGGRYGGRGIGRYTSFKFPLGGGPGEHSTDFASQ